MRSDYVNSSFENVAKIDANKITHEMLGEVPPNVAMLGALAKATGCVSLGQPHAGCETENSRKGW